MNSANWTTRPRRTATRRSNLYWGGAAGYFQAVVAGWGHSCAFGDFLDEPAGGVKCWGYNKNGELGDGHNINSNLSEFEVRVRGLYDVVALAAGDDHTCALLGNGSVKCWGLNKSGQLGDGTTNDSNTPVDVKCLFGGVVAIAAGWGHTCALIQDGGVRCWGSNQFGQLGDGTDVPYRSVRGIVAGFENDVAAISAGGAHTCAIRKDNQVRCWGENNFGQLGNGTVKNSNLPVLAKVHSRIDDEVLQLAAGRYHTCALMNLGRVGVGGTTNSANSATHESDRHNSGRCGYRRRENYDNRCGLGTYVRGYRQGRNSLLGEKRIRTVGKRDKHGQQQAGGSHRA